MPKAVSLFLVRSDRKIRNKIILFLQQLDQVHKISCFDIASDRKQDDLTNKP